MTKSKEPDVSDDIKAMPSVSTFIWNSDDDAGILSPGAQALLGVASPMSTDAFFSMVHPEDRTRAEAAMTAFLEAGGSHTDEYRILRPDGTVVHVIAHGAVTQNEDTGQLRVEGMFIDVTVDRAHAESHTPSGTEQFGFYDYDVASGTSTWSPELRRMLLRPEADRISSDDIYAGIHPDDRAASRDYMETALHTPGPFSATFRIVLPDGRELRVQDRGEAHGPLDPATGLVARVTGTLTDVTDAIAQAKAHRSGQDAFWALIDTAPFGVYAVDADFRIARVNEVGMAAFVGVDPLIGRDLGEVLHILWPEAFASEAIGHFRHTLATGTPYRAEPVIEHRADRGKLEAYDWGIDRVRLADGRYGVICHFYDLTERVRYEQELEDRERRLALAYGAADMGAWEADLTTGETVWTAQVYRLFGADADTEGPNEIWRRAIHPDDAPRVDAAFRTAVETQRTMDVDYRIRLPDGEVRYIASRAEMLAGADGVPERMIGVNYDVTARTMADYTTRDAERRMRVVIDSAVAFIGVLGPDGRLQEANQPALSAGGLTREDVLGKKFWDTYWWTHDDKVAADLQAAYTKACEGEIAHYDVVVRMAGDVLITIEFMLVPVFDDDGKLEMLVASGFDISEREQANARIRSLMGEINHRSKNILTLVQIVARQTAKGGAEDFIDRFERRVAALAQAQDLLIKGAGDEADLRDLALSQMGHFQDLVGSRIRLSGPKIALSPHAAQSIGMALHELATNAGKYGALSVDEGRVDVSWDLNDSSDDGDEGGPTFSIEWVEHGGPPVTEPEEHGFGTTVIKSLTSANLNAEVALTYAKDGVRWTLSCPRDALLHRDM